MKSQSATVSWQCTERLRYPRRKFFIAAEDHLLRRTTVGAQCHGEKVDLARLRLDRPTHHYSASRGWGERGGARWRDGCVGVVNSGITGMEIPKDRTRSYAAHI